MEKARWNQTTDQFMLVTSYLAKSMVKEIILGLMALYTLVHGSKISSTGTANTLGLTAVDTLVNGKPISWMEKASYSMKMADLTKDNIRMILNMVKVYTNGQMVSVTMETGF